MSVRSVGLPFAMHQLTPHLVQRLATSSLPAFWAPRSSPSSATSAMHHNLVPLPFRPRPSSPRQPRAFRFFILQPHLQLLRFIPPQRNVHPNLVSATCLSPVRRRPPPPATMADFLSTLPTISARSPRHAGWVTVPDFAILPLALGAVPASSSARLLSQIKSTRRLPFVTPIKSMAEYMTLASQEIYLTNGSAAPMHSLTWLAKAKHTTATTRARYPIIHRPHTAPFLHKRHSTA